MSQNQLFSEFLANTKSDWLKKATSDLKGKPIESLTSNWYGLNIKPYYTQEDLNSIETISQLVTKNNGWINYVRIEVESAEEANKLAHKALMLGATGIVFDLKNTPDYSKLLVGIELLNCAIAFSGNVDVDDYLRFSGAQNQADSLVGFIDNTTPNKTIISNKFYTSVIHGQTNNELLELQEILQEINLLLGSFAKNETDLIVQNMAYQVQMSTNYFFGIAKIRALRILLSRIYTAYHLNLSPADFHIIAASAPWIESDYEPHENMLKATTSGMAAIMGGANSIIVSPGYKDVQEELVARNISSILEFESYLNKVADPAAGSYFIEHLTDDIVSKVWTEFNAELKVKIGFEQTGNSKNISQNEPFDSAQGIPIQSFYQANLTHFKLVFHLSFAAPILPCILAGLGP